MKPSLTFLALGDSYTIGEGVPERERWPAQLVAKLDREGIRLEQPRIIAKTGWTTDELSAAIDEAKINGQTFDLVTLLIGVNNQFRGRDLEEYRRQFVELLKRAVVFARADAKHVIVVSIPDWGVTPFAKERDRAKVAREIDEFNRVNREESKKAGARYVDVTPLSRASPQEVVADGLHPSGAMYARWADAVSVEARAALSGK
jgi:lysophospholipase L1-like esterase